MGINIKSAKLSVEINSSELIIQTPAREVWIGRGSFEASYPGVTPGTQAGYGGTVTARYFAGLFLITTRKAPREARERPDWVIDPPVIGTTEPST